MMRILTSAACAALLAGLAGCGELDQSKTADNTNRGDAAPWQGAKNSYVAQGWKAGDKASWEKQLQTRGQSQNEYLKSN
ncbi:hypothetical protein [Noviherbaspirillum malthae]|jgi:hypothetical protein|uniref:hypothetical protein n=1 Tax=Noviherbaspirillum malthae TaxID=1260987 RepID=UPI001E39F9D4|nr:hypothetical protein [Noviherbaspirillum malthae]